MTAGVGGATEDEDCLLTPLEEEGGNFVSVGSTLHDNLLGRLTFLELLIKESRNVALGQEVIKLFAGVHGVGHKYRRRQVIARYLHVLNLTSLRIEESITEDYGTASLQVVHKPHRDIGRDRSWSFQVGRKIVPQTRGLAAKDRFDASLGDSSRAIDCLATSLCLGSSRHRNI